MSSQIVARAINTQSPFVGLREFLPRHPQAICATCSSSPAVVSKEGPPGLASTLPPPPLKGRCACQGLVGRGGRAGASSDRWEGAGEVQPRIEQEPSLHPCYLAKHFLPSLFPFPRHLGHLTGHPVSYDMMYPGCVLSRVLLRVRGSSEHRWVEA